MCKTILTVTKVSKPLTRLSSLEFPLTLVMVSAKSAELTVD